MLSSSDIKHLYNRASFGDVRVHDQTPSAIRISTLLAKRDPQLLDMVPTPATRPSPEMNKEILKEKLVKSRQDMLKLNMEWINILATTHDPAREKMVLFWHDHFACRTQIPYFAQRQNNLLRQHAMGNFSDLLLAVSKDAAMLQFLNNQQNKKGHPNENFAREVMELFTLGRGNYTEDDVKEAARAFTGWGFNREGNFIFKEKQHDFGTKTFRGKTKSYTGEDIIDAILNDNQTAQFITQKLVFYFTGQSIDDKNKDELARSFYKSGYDIEKLLRDIFSSAWFYDARYTGNRIKSPVELLTGILRQTGGSFENPQSAVFIQRTLGQLLFYPPNVGGWPQGKEWIDSSSLTFRMSLPQILFQAAATEVEAKDDGDVNSIKEDHSQRRNLALNVNWEKLGHDFAGKTDMETFNTIQDFLLSKPVSVSNQQLIVQRSSDSNNEGEFVKKVFTGLMSTPEYQLC